MIFNVNDYVKVKLTDHGKAMLRADHALLWMDRDEPPYEFKLPEEDTEGWSRWHLWDLMHRFGKHIYLGADMCFQTEIDFVLTDVPTVPAGYALVPIEPTEDMVIAGFESAPHRGFDGDAYPEEFDEMSGCQQAAFIAKRCYQAMLKEAAKEGA